MDLDIKLFGRAACTMKELVQMESPTQARDSNPWKISIKKYFVLFFSGPNLTCDVNGILNSSRREPAGKIVKYRPFIVNSRLTIPLYQTETNISWTNNSKTRFHL